MTWVLPEILIPLLLALGLGVLIGWLLWRWRRRSIHASEWNQLTTNAAQAQADEAAVRAAYEEANNERSILANQLTALTDDLETARNNETEARERAERLAIDLEINTNELTEATEHAGSLERQLHAATTSTAERDAAQAEVAQVREELEAKLSGLRGEHEAEISRLRDELETGAVRRSQLEQAVEERDNELARALNELNDLTHRTEQLQAELDSGVNAAAVVGDRVDDAEAKAAELEAALAAARTELDVSQGRIADFDARLSTASADLDAAHARVSELETKAQENEAGGAALIGQLRVDLAERDRRIAALEAAAAPVGIGISVADHVDDLKVIRGIGPRMEDLLTTLGITSWEQLAGLDEAGIARVDNALREFPGRIERDQWVDQARELVERFPDVDNRPNRETFLNRTQDEEPFS